MATSKVEARGPNPGRAVRPNRRSVTGIYIARTGTGLAFESQLERDAYLALDFEPAIQKVTSQPMRLGNWFPDCLVEIEGKRILVEVKYETELVERWPELSLRYAALSEQCKRENFIFRAITDDSIYYPETNRTKGLKTIKAIAGKKSHTSKVEDSIANLVSGTDQVTMRGLTESLDPRNGLASNLREVCSVLAWGPRYLLRFPSSSLFDCTVAIASKGQQEPCRALSYEALKERIETHPLRSLRAGGAFVVA